jgi:hypothetical protein
VRCGDLPERPGQPIGQGTLAVLEHQRPEVPRVEELDVDRRVQFAQAAQLAVLLAHELLAQRRHLEIQVELGQEEVGSEALHHRAIQVPQDREGVRFVVPADSVEVQDSCHLRLAGVGEGDPSVHRR